MKQEVILLVEDNHHDVDLTKRAFLKTNIMNEIVVAEDGEEALDYLFGRGTYADRDCSQQPAIILLDLNLPKIDGLEVLRQVRNDIRTYLVPVIVLSTSREDSDLRAAYSLGANSYINKPVDFNQFLEIVSKLGVYWLLLNEPFPMG